MINKIYWAEYLLENEKLKDVVNNEKHIQEWQSYLEKNNKDLKNEIAIVSNDLFVTKKDLVLEFLLINNKDQAVKELEISIKLIVFGEEYFSGTLRMNNNVYQPLLPKEARLDLVNFGNDRFKHGKYSKDDYKLNVIACKEIEYQTN